MSPWVAALLARWPSAVEVMGYALALVLVTGALLLVVAYVIMRGRSSRRADAAAVIEARRKRAESDGLTYFARQRERQVETRETSTTATVAPLPTASREQAQRDLAEAHLSDRLDVVWQKIADEIGKPPRKVHPLGWTLVGVRGRLCAVAPGGCVDLYSEATCAWIPADQDMTRAARGVLGLST